MLNKQQVIDETIEKYERYINPAIAKLFRFMGLSTIEWKAEGNAIYDIEGKNT